MISNKLTPFLQLALRYENLLVEDLKRTFIVDPINELWEVVMNYDGDLDEIKSIYNIAEAYSLNGGYAQIIIPKDEIGNLSNAGKVFRLSLPRRLEYTDIGLGQICASTISQPNSAVMATGEGVLVAVIDSGIRYNHPDFISPSGESRILYLWDQNIGEDRTANNGGGGTVYTSAQINEALSYSDEAEQQRIVPSIDTLGHGTALAGVAAGNGRGSANQINKGVAPECELIIVKLNQTSSLYPRDVDIMQGINFAIAMAEREMKPLIILIGAGNNLAGHDGSDPLELYMTSRYNNWLLNFVVGMGNEGDRSSHASGRVATGQTQTVQISVEGPTRKEYGCCIRISAVDEMQLVVQAPNGERTDAISILTPNRAYLFDEVAVLINYSEPITNIGNMEIYIIFQAQGEARIENGLWTLILTGKKIIQGNYDVWGAIVPRDSNEFIRFLNPDLNVTLTAPATAYSVTKVGAYNSAILQIAAFSGRGFTADGRIAPTIVAPGVNITVPSISSDTLYTASSGTSIAAAFVAGAYAVMMGYGVYTLNSLSYYGEVLRVYLIRNARRPASYEPYPNNSWGYGLMCVEAALLDMKEIAEQTS